MKSVVKYFHISLVVVLLSAISSCDNADPVKEDVPELITKVELKFSETGGGTTVAIEAIDPDGEGVQDIQTSSPINLKPNTTYTLKISLYNTLADPGDEGYDIGEEVEAEGDEHMFFFSWTKNAFSTPSGNGNIDARADQVIYSGGSNATDDNGLPLGLTTTWTSGPAVAGAAFRVKLMHQPGIKTATSDASMGETDMDVTFVLNVQ